MVYSTCFQILPQFGLPIKTKVSIDAQSNISYYLHWKCRKNFKQLLIKIHVHYVEKEIWKILPQWNSLSITSEYLSRKIELNNFFSWNSRYTLKFFYFLFFFYHYPSIFFIIIIIWNWYKLLAQENLQRIVNKDIMTSLPTHYTCIAEINHAAGSPICWSDSMIVEELWFILSC